MKAQLPKYYTRLRPFMSAFTSGFPILTYHKVGQRPRGARLKGLYVSRRLFEEQLEELRLAGFQSHSLHGFPKDAASGSRFVILTFDDGFQIAFRNAPEPLARSGFRAIQFLVSERLGCVNDWEMAEGEVQEPLMDRAQVTEWLAAGHEIGSHTNTHPFLTRISAAQAKEEISSSKRKLEDTFGRPIRHFCYPYGDYNQAVADLVQQAGYQTACTTRGGVNNSTTSPYQLLRFTARYRSRSLKNLRQWLELRLGIGRGRGGPSCLFW
jgi:peptidoglycan/xylan/chitin deacetylase (PgdA/CDA1 family)